LASTDARCDRTAGNLDATAAPELEQAVVAQQAQRAQPGVRVEAYRCEVPRRGKSLAGQRFVVGDSPDGYRRRPAPAAGSDDEAGVACARRTTGKHRRAKRKRRAFDRACARDEGQQRTGPPAHYRFDVIAIPSASRASLSDLVLSSHDLGAAATHNRCCVRT